MAGREGLSYGVSLVETLHAASAEVHLVLSPAAEQALEVDLDRVCSLATQVYAHGNQAARISSGSFLTRGMAVVPCDGAALAAITLGLATNLVFRAADVTLKEQRPLVLGLTSTRPTAIEREHIERARQVPRLSVITLAGAPAAGAAAVLDQLNAARD